MNKTYILPKFGGKNGQEHQEVQDAIRNIIEERRKR